MGKTLTTDNKLTDKQEMFCQQYVIDYNGKQAAISAGYNKNTATMTASENLTKPYILARISELSKELLRTTKLSQEIVIKKLEKMATFRVTDMVTIEDGRVIIKNTAGLPDEILDNIVSITRKKGKYGDSVEVKFADKQKALVDLGRYFGMFVDRMAVSTDLTVRVDDFTDANYRKMNEEAKGITDEKKEIN